MKRVIAQKIQLGSVTRKVNGGVGLIPIVCSEGNDRPVVLT